MVLGSYNSLTAPSLGEKLTRLTAARGDPAGIYAATHRPRPDTPPYGLTVFGALGLGAWLDDQLLAPATPAGEPGSRPVATHWLWNLPEHTRTNCLISARRWKLSPAWMRVSAPTGSPSTSAGEVTTVKLALAIASADLDRFKGLVRAMTPFPLWALWLMGRPLPTTKLPDMVKIAEGHAPT